MADATRDPPIEPLDYIGGVKVADIGDLRVARGKTRRPSTSCRHRQLRYDLQERRIWCPDCEMTIEAFDAFESLVSQFSAACDDLERRQKVLAEATQFQARAIATKRLDEVWRQRTMVPACPHCHAGLFPDDFKHGVTSLGVDYAKALAERSKKLKGGGDG